MKKYCVGVRNNEKHAYSIVCKTNHKWIAKLSSLLYKPFVNEAEIAITSEIVIKNNEPPFADKYLHKEDVENIYFYIWRGWWQRVGKLIYNTWNGEKYSTYFPLDESEQEEFESVFMSN